MAETTSGKTIDTTFNTVKKENVIKVVNFLNHTHLVEDPTSNALNYLGAILLNVREKQEDNKNYTYIYKFKKDGYLHVRGLIDSDQDIILISGNNPEALCLNLKPCWYDRKILLCFSGEGNDHGAGFLPINKNINWYIAGLGNDPDRWAISYIPYEGSTISTDDYIAYTEMVPKYCFPAYSQINLHGHLSKDGYRIKFKRPWYFEYSTPSKDSTYESLSSINDIKNKKFLNKGSDKDFIQKQYIKRNNPYTEYYLQYKLNSYFEKTNNNYFINVNIEDINNPTSTICTSGLLSGFPLSSLPRHRSAYDDFLFDFTQNTKDDRFKNHIINYKFNKFLLQGITIGTDKTCRLNSYIYAKEKDTYNNTYTNPAWNECRVKNPSEDLWLGNKPNTTSSDNSSNLYNIFTIQKVDNIIIQQTVDKTNKVDTFKIIHTFNWLDRLSYRSDTSYCTLKNACCATKMCLAVKTNSENFYNFIKNIYAPTDTRTYIDITDKYLYIRHGNNLVLHIKKIKRKNNNNTGNIVITYDYWKYDSNVLKRNNTDLEKLYNPGTDIIVYSNKNEDYIAIAATDENKDIQYPTIREHNPHPIKTYFPNVWDFEYRDTNIKNGKGFTLVIYAWAFKHQFCAISPEYILKLLPDSKRSLFNEKFNPNHYFPISQFPNILSGFELLSTWTVYETTKNNDNYNFLDNDSSDYFKIDEKGKRNLNTNVLSTDYIKYNISTNITFNNYYNSLFKFDDSNSDNLDVSLDVGQPPLGKPTYTLNPSTNSYTNSNITATILYNLEIEGTKYEFGGLYYNINNGTDTLLTPSATSDQVITGYYTITTNGTYNFFAKNLKGASGEVTTIDIQNIYKITPPTPTLTPNTTKDTILKILVECNFTESTNANIIYLPFYITSELLEYSPIQFVNDKYIIEVNKNCTLSAIIQDNAGNCSLPSTLTIDNCYYGLNTDINTEISYFYLHSLGLEKYLILYNTNHNFNNTINSLIKTGYSIGESFNYDDEGNIETTYTYNNKISGTIAGNLTKVVNLLLLLYKLSGICFITSAGTFYTKKYNNIIYIGNLLNINLSSLFNISVEIVKDNVDNNNLSCTIQIKNNNNNNIILSTPLGDKLEINVLSTSFTDIDSISKLSYSNINIDTDTNIYTHTVSNYNSENTYIYLHMVLDNINYYAKYYFNFTASTPTPDPDPDPSTNI